ncbi:hypothetical protein PWT90_11216 [Aphanocladium album]|nr:hypothetical protein PWT90_11216 [Aphanocladium album]
MDRYGGGAPSLYAQLCDRADGVVLAFFDPDVVGLLYGGTELDEPATFAVFLLFDSDEDRRCCWHMLKQSMAVSATAWFSRDVGEGDLSGFTLVLMLHPDGLLHGVLAFDELDAELTGFLGDAGSSLCDVGSDARGRASRISYEVVEQDRCADWVQERERLFMHCDKVEYTRA